MRKVLCVVALAAVLASCGAVTPYAATVNGHRISQRELDRELRDIRANKAYLDALEQGQFPVRGTGTGTFDSAFVARVLTRQILLELVHQEVERRHLPVTSDDLAIARDDVLSGFTQDPKMFDKFEKRYRDDLVRRTAEVNTLQAALAGKKIDATAIAAYYSQHKDEFAQTCVRHILVDTKEAADAVKARLSAGEDFAAVAKAESKDPGSGPKGGDLGCVAPGQFVPEFETAMQSLAVNQISEPVQTQFGFHVIQVTARKPQPLDEVRSQIRQNLLGNAQTEFNAFLDKTIKGAKVTVNPRFGHFTRANGRAEVVPPQAPTTTVAPKTTPSTTVPTDNTLPAPEPESTTTTSTP